MLKKHKKHKKHKKKQRDYEQDMTELTVVDVVSDVADVTIVEEPPTQQLHQQQQPQHLLVDMSAADKLKSQFTPKSTLSSLATTTTNTPTQPTAKSASKKKKPTRAKDSGTSSEEERWLDAIESGKLEQVDDELKKIKDPKLMTARQRAMYERGTDKESHFAGAELLMALPSGYKEKVMTAEAIQKAQIKSQKRKQLADEKREKDKKKTMERLLKKQDSKSAKNFKSRHTKTVSVPMIIYRNTVDGATITFPVEMATMPLVAQCERAAPKRQLCALCGDQKRYSCSKTNMPLCSFRCYKQNVASLKEIMC